jgi:hypothetical protein
MHFVAAILIIAVSSLVTDGLPLIPDAPPPSYNP